MWKLYITQIYSGIVPSIKENLYETVCRQMQTNLILKPLCNVETMQFVYHFRIRLVLRTELNCLESIARSFQPFSLELLTCNVGCVSRYHCDSPEMEWKYCEILLR